MSEFTWIPFYKELAYKLTNYKERQGELIVFLESLKNKGISSIPLIDKDLNNEEIKLDSIDPFTFFATFNRGITNENRILILKEIKDIFQIDSELPGDFSGIPVVSNFKTWFFAFKKDRKENDISLLWNIAIEAINSPGNLNDNLFKECLNIRGITITNLTMGLFWINPESFSACDSRIKEYLNNHDYRFPKIKNLSDYQAHLIQLKKFLPNVPFYKISFDAWTETSEVEEHHSTYQPGNTLIQKVRYWAGGYHLESTVDISPELFEKNIWRMGYSSDEEKGKSFYGLIRQVRKGDFIILKSYGGKDILTISALGKVVETSDADKGILGVDWLVKNRIYKGSSPKGQGGGNWWGTFLEVTRQSEIKKFFTEQLLNQIDDIRKNKYWVYSPGHKATKWEEFYSKGIMAIGWGDLGNLKDYPDKASITAKLQDLSLKGNPGSMKNDSTACYEFANVISPGDIVFVKSKQKELIGYGIVKSDYEYKQERAEYKHFREVDWKLKGIWPTDFNLVQKTLTDVTKYKTDNPNYEMYSEELMAIIMGEYKPKDKITKVEYPLNQILFGPPGTGKTYYSINHALAIIENKTIEELETESEENREVVLKRYKTFVESGQILFTTFHQSMCYEDFIEGIKPIEVDYQLSYELKDGIFKTISENALSNYRSFKKQSVKKPFDEAWNSFLKPLSEGEHVKVQMKKSSYEISYVTDKTIFFDKDSGESKHSLSINTLKAMYNDGANNIITGGLQPYYEPLLNELLKGSEQTKNEDLKNFVLIIDEINRGNVSQIFGELITLIEKDKRLGASEELTVTLPYSKKKGFGVPSNLYIIGTMNTADRSVEALDTALRRRFTFIEMPPNYELQQLETEMTEEITLLEILKTLNYRIEKLLDKDHIIGHSYFLNIKDLEGLKDVFQYNIIPLLQEYFYGDFAKIGLVLGEAFFEQETVINNVKFAKYKHDAIDDLNARSVIKLKRYWKDGDFEQAIKELVNPG